VQEWAATLTGPFDWADWPLAPYIFGEAVHESPERQRTLTNALIAQLGLAPATKWALREAGIKNTDQLQRRSRARRAGKEAGSRLDKPQDILTTAAPYIDSLQPRALTKNTTTNTSELLKREAMNKATVLVLIVTQMVATAGVAMAHPTSPSSSKHGKTGISVLTYFSGGPRRATRAHLFDDATVRVRSNAQTILRSAKKTKNGHIFFSMAPGVYRIEATLEPPAVSPQRSCGTPQTIRVRANRQTTVRLYCSAR